MQAAATVPFVARGFPPAVTLAKRDTRWRDGTALCQTHPRLCAMEGNGWRWEGWQMQYQDPSFHGTADEQLW